MQRNRRAFLRVLAGGAGLAGAATWWVAASQRRAARWARRLVQEAQRPIAPAPVTPAPRNWSDNEITLCWLGHATVLLNFYGVRILTDPALGSRVGISLGLGTLGPKRYVAPALKFRDLPPLDLVLLSHAHMDHMDLPTLRQFGARPTTVTASDTADILSGTGLKRVKELRWNDRSTFRFPQGELSVEAVEVKHWGQRWPSDRPRGYNGYVLRREGRAVLFAGDTAKTPLFAGLRPRGPFEVAIMPIGAYRPWIWNHCTPEEAFEMADAAGARYIAPVHHQTFQLSDEPMTEPIERLQNAMASEPARLALRRIGETFVLPRG